MLYEDHDFETDITVRFHGNRPEEYRCVVLYERGRLCFQCKHLGRPKSLQNSPRDNSVIATLGRDVSRKDK